MVDRVKGRINWTSQSWVRTRKVVQAVAFLLFLFSFVNTRRASVYEVSAEKGWETAVAQLPLRLDPLLMLANGLANRRILLGSTMALVTILLTLIFGRVWCGWLCPLGTLLDWIPGKKSGGREHSPSQSWRSVKYVLLITTLSAALFSNLTLLIFDPLTILYRTFSTAIWPGLDQLVTGGERLLYRLSFMKPFIARFDVFLRPGVLPSTPVFYRYTFFYAGVFIAVLALNAVASRFWCRYLCPLGALLGLMGKFSFIKHTIASSCSGCGLCFSVCPTDAIREGNQGKVESHPSECTLCMLCLDECPGDAVNFVSRWSIAEWKPYDPGRRQALLGLGASIVGVGLMGSDVVSNRNHPHLIRPPGAKGEDFLQTCLRCGACVYACPTGTIQPSLLESGLEGLWTPLVVPRLGYCDYSCHACGQVCPVGAIPELSLEEKREQVLGKAYIDENRCIAWADDEDCIVCEEMCPVAEKAIFLEEAEVPSEEGGPRTVHRPHVRREVCIGCGICEYKCPIPGTAAIRVYVSPT